MKKDTLTLLMTTLLAGMLDASPVFAQAQTEAKSQSEGCHHAYLHTRSAQWHRMGKRLGLSQEQRSTLRAIFEKNRPQMNALRDAQKNSKHQLQTLLDMPHPDATQIRRLADQQGKIVADMIVLRTKMRSEINQIMTPDQRKKMLHAREIRHMHPETRTHQETLGIQTSHAATEHLSLLLQAHRDALL